MKTPNVNCKTTAMKNFLHHKHSKLADKPFLLPVEQGVNYFCPKYIHNDARLQ